MRYSYKVVAFMFAFCVAIVVPVSLKAQGWQRTPALDSLLNALKTAKEDTIKVTILTRLSLSYRYFEPTKGVEYGQKAAALAEQLEWPKGMSHAYSALANNYLTMSDYVKAIEYYSKARTIDEEQGDTVTLGKNTINVGILYFNQGNYPKALEYYFKALKIEENIKNKADIASCMLNIGVVYSRQENYPKALEYFFKSLALAEELGDKAGIAHNYGNIGLVYKAQKNYTKALEYYEKGLQINRELGAKSYIIADLGNIANLYRNEGNYAKAFDYFDQSMKMAEEVGDKFSIAISLGNIGEAWLEIAKDTTGKAGAAGGFVSPGKSANLGKAISYMEKSLALSKELGDIDGIQEVSKNLSEAMALSGNYKEAYRYHVQYLQYNDSLQAERSKVKIAGLEAQRSVDLKERDLQIEKLKAKNKRNERLLYISSIVLLLVAMGIVLNKFLKQARSNERLTREQKKNLARIKEQSNVLENFAHTQAHEMRGQVVKILGLTKLFNYENTGDPANKELMENVANVTDELDKLVKGMIARENNFNKESRGK